MLDEMKSMLRKPSPEALASNELDEARRSLLSAQSAREYAESMVVYHQRRIERLRGVLAQAVQV